jgi:hypothetical protein
MELAERQQQHRAANNWSRSQEASSHAVSGGAQAAMSGLGYTGLGGTTLKGKNSSCRSYLKKKFFGVSKLKTKTVVI